MRRSQVRSGKTHHAREYSSTLLRMGSLAISHMRGEVAVTGLISEETVTEHMTRWS